MSVKLENPNITTNPTEVITQAAEMIEKHPEIWGKGQWVVFNDERGMRREYDDDRYLANDEVNACTIGGVCQVCLEGALLLFAADEETYREAKHIVEEYIGDIPMEFNDYADTDSPDVVRVLRGSVA